MEPRHLLQWLMDRDELNSSSLARLIKSAGVSEKPTTQPQIHKFLGGKAVEPKRATLQPVADYFKIPIDAFYDGQTAERVMEELKAGRVIGAARKTENLPAGVHEHGSIDETLATLCGHLSRVDPLTRKAAGGVLMALAQQPDSLNILDSLTALMRPVPPR